eukprot:TRINITY_DN1266_c1_g1_i5.p1 TRINITY_DN1266_c1_g1~~TRINITY_DN1266_c1_g1_i5.p1  ORF type:complete len:561 (-),score=126.95 TRINITY_DN1266_c1_g1_i5:47-1729(-)
MEHSPQLITDENKEETTSIQPLSPLRQKIETFLQIPTYASKITEIKKRNRRSETRDKFPTEPWCFAWLPPWKEFFGTDDQTSSTLHSPEDKRLKKKLAFEALQPDMIVKGVIHSKRTFGIIVEVIEVCDLDREKDKIKGKALEKISELDVKALCHLSELSDFNVKDAAQELDLYCIGDNVVAIVLNVNPEDERVSLSFKRSRLSTPTGSYVLGKCDSPISEKKNEDDTEPRELVYNQLLLRDSAFHNPHALESMIGHFNLDQLGSFFTTHCYKEEDFYDKLREKQNKTWAQETVARGIASAKKGEYEAAMKCYGEALQVHPSNPDAFVARGAAYANQNLLPAAIKEFKTALRIDPQDLNAQKYLAICQQKMIEKEEEKKLKEEELEKKNKDAVRKRSSSHSRIKKLLKEEKHRKKKDRKKEKKRKSKHKRKSKTHSSDEETSPKKKRHPHHKSSRHSHRQHSRSRSPSTSPSPFPRRSQSGSRSRSSSSFRSVSRSRSRSRSQSWSRSWSRSRTRSGSGSRSPSSPLDRTRKPSPSGRNKSPVSRSRSTSPSEEYSGRLT